MAQEIDLSVVVLSWNTKALTLTAIGAVEAAAAPFRAETICVDNASADGSAAAVRAAFPAVRVIECAVNLGFARGNNVALPQVHGRYVCFLNSDTEARPGSLAHVVAYLDAHPAAGVACPRLVFPDGRPQRAAWGWPTAKAMLYQHTPLGWVGFGRADAKRVRPRRDAVERTGPVEAANGCCLFVRRDLCERLGGFDEGYPFYYEDVDLAWRAHQAGVEVHVALDGPPVIHHGGASTALAEGSMRLPFLRGILRFERRTHGPVVARLFSAVFKVGVVVRSLGEVALAPAHVAWRRLCGRREQAERASAATRKRRQFLRNDLWVFLKS